MNNQAFGVVKSGSAEFRELQAVQSFFLLEVTRSYFAAFIAEYELSQYLMLQKRVYFLPKALRNLFHFFCSKLMGNVLSYNKKLGKDSFEDNILATGLVTDN